MLLPIMDLAIHHLISSAVTFAVATTMVSVQMKHKKDMLALQEIIEKSLLLRKSIYSTLPPNPDASSKAFSPADLLSKTTKR